MLLVVAGLIPLAGIIFGLAGGRRIRSARTSGPACGWRRSGMGVSVRAYGCWAVGWLIFVHASEVPFGYSEVTYEKLQPGPGELIPEKARELDDKKVFIKGYMHSRAGR